MNIYIKSLIILFVLPWGIQSANCQKKPAVVIPAAVKPANAIMIDIAYGAYLPMADMAENFKYNFSLSSKIQYLMSNNIMFGIVAEYQFSEDIKKDVVSNLREPTGSIIDKFGNYSDVVLGQRGFFGGLTVGYLIPLFKKTKRSGIEVRFSGGYQQHWVNIKVIGAEIFALKDQYKKGYDRMTSGFAMSQYIGYRHLDKGGLLNFFGGFSIMEAFTKNRRGFNFDTGKEDTKDRIDILLGFRLGLSIPFYLYSADTEQEIRYY